MSKIFTFEEIEAHNTRDDLWMVIDGKVYDCTSFLDEHPGGEEVMIDCGGIDATGPFDDIGHSEDAREMLEPLLIGVIDPKSVASNASSSATSTSSGQTSPVPMIFAVLAAISAAGYYFLVFKK